LENMRNSSSANGEGMESSISTADEQKESAQSMNGDNNSGLEKINTRQWAAEHGYDPKILFKKFFHDDIKYLLIMADLWKDRRKPEPLDWHNLPDENPSSSRSKSSNNDLWTVMECRVQFEKTVDVLRERIKDGSNLSWDKDDDAAMRFVAACANIRAHVFDIPLKTLFDIKCNRFANFS
uniref:UBA_e1_thiolCys domain-containing protein n=1 Tax=Gongylonema pulchrum TaxID=637853 RepID=A0A183DCG3_9BILA